MGGMQPMGMYQQPMGNPMKPLGNNQRNYFTLKNAFIFGLFFSFHFHFVNIYFSLFYFYRIFKENKIK